MNEAINRESKNKFASLLFVSFRTFSYPTEFDPLAIFY